MSNTTLYLDDEQVELPTLWTICGACRGEGKSSAYLGAYTSSEWAEQDDDFREDYMNGAYNRPCDACNGSGKIKKVDESCLSPEHLEAWRAQCVEDQHDRQVAYWERLHESGGMH